jgi:crotonobetainyl-CoA:carnitine CoA-transferase CaiB-like acyl-CoA transferase
VSLLGPIRVLDVAGEFWGLPGKILAEMGADVVRIEPPVGEPARSHAPLHAVESLPWTAFNLSKRSVTLNLESERGRAIFLQLVDRADVVLESFRPGRMAELGLAPERLMERRPSLVVTSLTAFGQTGPYAGNAASDITVMALSGLMAVTGFPGLPPLRLSHDQTLGLGALQAALGTLMALYSRGATGEGQHVDVSALDAARLANYREPLRWEFQQAVEVRRGNVARRGRGGFVATIWKCADGWITWSASDDPKRARSLFDMAHGLGIALDWRDHDFAALAPQDMPQDEIDRLEADIAPFFERHTRDRLETMAREHGWILIGLLDLAEAAAQPQLDARGFWMKVPFAGGDVTVPAFPFRTSEAQPLTCGPAPALGADTDAVLGELGLGPDELAELRRAEVI